MRNVLLKRVRPLADSFAKQLIEIAARRIETEIGRMGEAFEVAMSAFASEVSDADPDSRDHGAVPQVPRGARRGVPLHQDRALPHAAQAPVPRRPQGERPARLVGPPEDLLLTNALGPDLAAALNPRGRTQTFPADKRGRADKTAITASGKRPVTCRQCGFVGGNTRGCGTSHRTILSITGGQTKPHASVHRPTTPDRRVAISNWATRRGDPPPRPPAAEHDPDDGRDEPVRPPGSERWTKGRIALEASLAEAKKAKGDLPVPSSSFDLGHDGAEAGMASVREMGPEDELDFEASA